MTVIGARPQFIKAAAVSRILQRHDNTVEEMIIHTGQHYDSGMSKIFFDELEITKPAANLNIGSGGHGLQIGKMLIKLEEIILKSLPDLIMVYGDTNSTLAGALAASKLHRPVIHVEAGLRSFNRAMPEEINRVLTDHISDILFCPSDTAIDNLRREGLTNNVWNVGDVMYDSVLHNIKLAEKKITIIERLKLSGKSYALATVHRTENTDDPERLRSIFRAFETIAKKYVDVILPLHPRTLKYLEKYEIRTEYARIIDPVPYLDMLVLEKNAKVVLTDSGGVQKEAYWFKVPCVTLREETEWVETVKYNWNTLTGSNTQAIIDSSSLYAGSTTHTFI